MKNIIITEKSNPNTLEIDLKSPLDIVTLINNEDKLVASAVEAQLEKIAEAIELIASRFKRSGSLLYFGAGTSGRLGILDASECPPTFGVDQSMVRGYIAGGDTALRKAIEGAEDNFEQGENDLISSKASKSDIVVGISASGNAPYVCGILSKANNLGISTIAITCNKDSQMAKIANIPICVEVGPEVVTGSSRMKAGSAQKMVLNMLTTGSMILIGKTYRNFMIDLNPSNIKLIDRATRIVAELSGSEYDKAKDYLFLANKNVKLATIMLKKDLDINAAKDLLEKNNGKLRNII